MEQEQTEKDIQKTRIYREQGHMGNKNFQETRTYRELELFREQENTGNQIQGTKIF